MRWEVDAMKRIALLVWALCLMLVLTGCSGLGKRKLAIGGADSKALVAYFSCTQNTGRVAEHIADIVGADLYEIVPQEPYTDEDLQSDGSSGRLAEEQYGENVRPAIAGSVENMEDYSIVFVGYPIWWGDAPKIICTFLESYDFSGKTIIPFCTSSSTGMGSSATDIHGSTSSSARWLDGTRFPSGAARRTVVDWLDEFTVRVAE